jgi:hydroxypyruvate isomerase
MAFSMFASDRITNNIPKKVKGYAAKLMVGVYDIGKQRLDADRTYTIELMQTNAELMREDVVALLNSINRKSGADIPGASGQVADQGIQ